MGGVFTGKLDNGGERLRLDVPGYDLAILDFTYSDALKAKEGVWDDQTLDAFLADPQANVPGTAMFGSAPDPAQRHAIIELLKTLK